MNLLFVLHGSIESNSGYHVQAHARGLAALGTDCTIVCPQHYKNDKDTEACDIRVLGFDEALSSPLHANEEAPDILHAWTPREHVRRFCHRLYERIQPARTVIHLEDNEEYLAEKAAHRRWPVLKDLSDAELEKRIPAHLFHPQRGRRWLEAADGITMIVPELAQLNYGAVPAFELPPVNDTRLFFRRPRNDAKRHALGIADDVLVVAYTGNIHFANRAEVSSLYLAIALLQRRGIPALLVRTGSDSEPIIEGDQQWLHAVTHHLGMVERETLPDVLAMADIFVQPGSAGAFNDLRLPSKLPEFFAIGRPVILPRANIGKHLSHRKDAYVLEEGNAIGIYEAIKEIWQDRDLLRQLTAGALRVARRWAPDNAAQATKLLDFYASLLQSP